MRVLILSGSPHAKGTTAFLADAFESGAKEAGHKVDRFDVAAMDVHPCLGCDYCIDNGGTCIYQDDMQKLRAPILEADLIAFVSPTYYFGICAQLKKVIDRFYAINDNLINANKKACLLAACADSEAWSIEALEHNYAAICRYLEWKNAGEVLATGVATREDVVKTEYPQMARELGASL